MADNQMTYDEQAHINTRVSPPIHLPTRRVLVNPAWNSSVLNYCWVTMSSQELQVRLTFFRGLHYDLSMCSINFSSPSKPLMSALDAIFDHMLYMHQQYSCLHIAWHTALFDMGCTCQLCKVGCTIQHYQCEFLCAITALFIIGRMYHPVLPLWGFPLTNGQTNHSILLCEAVWFYM